MGNDTWKGIEKNTFLLRSKGRWP